MQQSQTSTGYFLGDALGSVRQLVDENGSVTLTKTYEPYGELASSSGLSAATAYGYTNEYTSLGLIFLRARYYAPTDGRFLTSDSWQGDYALPMSYNAWLYGYSNPVKYVDPSGMKAKMPWPLFQHILRALGENVNILRGSKQTNVLADYKGAAPFLVPTLTREEIALISLNFEDSPLDIACYKPFTFIKGYRPKAKCNGSECPIYGTYNRNQYDKYFSGWADYWAWRADADGPRGGLLRRVDPNLLKALAMNETGVGQKHERNNQFVISIDGPEIRRLRGDFGTVGGHVGTKMSTLVKYGMAWYSGDLEKLGTV